MSEGEAYLRRLQDESHRGFHRVLKAWVDDSSEVARVLLAMECTTES